MNRILAIFTALTCATASAGGGYLEDRLPPTHQWATLNENAPACLMWLSYVKFIAFFNSKDDAAATKVIGSECRMLKKGTRVWIENYVTYGFFAVEFRPEGDTQTYWTHYAALFVDADLERARREDGDKR
jgi:hypothetical protein